MSVSGRIEDFSVVDILQYLHSIQKSGVLHLKGIQDEAQIFFRQGQVVRATMPGMTNLGDVLVRTKGVKLEAIVQAAAHQRAMEVKKPLGAILVEKGFISEQVLREAVLFQIQDVIYRLVGWTTGEFHFEVKESSGHDDISVSLGDLVLPEEVNTEFLLLEAVRKFDEDRKKRKDADDPASQASLILLVSRGTDGDGLIRHLKDFQFRSHLTFSVREFLETLEKHCNDGRDPLAIAMIPSNGEFQIFLHGLASVLEGNPGLNVMVLGLALAPHLVMQFYEMGGRVFIPLGTDSPSDESNERLFSAIGRCVADLTEGETDLLHSGEDAAGMKLSFSLLQMMLKEVGQMEKSQAITLQFLNILSEHFERAVLFLVGGNEMRGIGGFGRGRNKKPLNEESKSMRIPITQRDLPRICLQEGNSFVGNIPREMWIQSLHEKIGSPKNREVILLPVRGVDSALCLVYGDNGDLAEGFRHVELLEIAAGQTGIIIENAFLRKQKKKLEAEQHA